MEPKVDSTPVSFMGNIVKFTPTAWSQVKKLMSQEKDPTAKALRLGVKLGGCSGYSYVFEVGDFQENDLKEVIEDINIAIDRDQMEKIVNLTVDYASGLNNRGFIFDNPNAKTTCGCGTSFS